jgi:hypothetical protein
MASGETLPILKEALVELTLGLSPLCVWVLIAEITDELILGLHILLTYDAFMDLACHILWLGQEVLFRSPRAWPWSFCLVE